MKANTKSTPHKKRHGHHQKRSNRFASVYLPYLPMTLILMLSLFLSGVKPSRGILAYATNVSASGLLQATNVERANNGQGALFINSQLGSAAQTKANDMAARNYWSHNTPDGQEPWVFVKNAGYSYLKAGENLAYGFTTSNETITGWMNSATHKANMLDAGFVDVGFGFVNSSSYNSSGEQTIVVAMYGKPQVLAASQQAAPPAPAPAPTKVAVAPTPVAVATPTPSPVEQPPIAAPVDKPTPVKVDTTQATLIEPQSQSINRAQTLTKGNAPWAVAAVSIMSGLAVASMLIKHSLGLSRLIRNSERFVLHHPLFDSTMVSLAILGLVLSKTQGIIR